MKISLNRTLRCVSRRFFIVLSKGCSPVQRAVSSRFHERKTERNIIHPIHPSRIKTKNSQIALATTAVLHTATSIMCVSTHPHIPHSLARKRNPSSRKQISKVLRHKKNVTPLNLNRRGGSISYKKKLPTVTKGAIR